MHIMDNKNIDLMQDKLNALVDGGLKPADQADVMTGLGDDAGSVETLRAWQAQREALRALHRPLLYAAIPDTAAGGCAPGPAATSAAGPVVALVRHGDRSDAGLWCGLVFAWAASLTAKWYAAGSCSFAARTGLCATSVFCPCRVFSRGPASCRNHCGPARPFGAVAVQKVR